MILQRNGLTLIQGSPFEGARGSRNVPIQLVHDSSYADYGFTMHCGYFVNGVEQETLLAINSEGDFLIPGEAYTDYGPLKLSVQLSKTGAADYMTNQLTFTVEPAPFGKVILPSTATWQELVGQYTQTLLDGYTSTVLEPKTEELSTMISNYNTVLSEYSTALDQTLNMFTTEVLDVYDQRINDDITQFEQEYGDAYTPGKAVTFTEAEVFENIVSSENFPEMLGKIQKWLGIIGDPETLSIGTNLVDASNQLNSNLGIKISGYGTTIAVEKNFVAPSDGFIRVEGRVPADSTQTIYINIGGSNIYNVVNAPQSRYYATSFAAKKMEKLTILYNSIDYEPVFTYTPFV